MLSFSSYEKRLEPLAVRMEMYLNYSRSEVEVRNLSFPFYLTFFVFTNVATWCSAFRFGLGLTKTRSASSKPREIPLGDLGIISLSGPDLRRGGKPHTRLLERAGKRQV